MQSQKSLSKGTQSSGSDRITELKWMVNDRSDDDEENQTKNLLPYPKIVKYLLLVSFLQDVSLETIFSTALNHAGIVMRSSELSTAAYRLVLLGFCTGCLIAVYFSDAVCGPCKSLYYFLATHIVVQLFMMSGILTNIAMMTKFSGILLMIVAGASRSSLLVIGANQFRLPTQKKQIVYYFLWFYFTTELGMVAGNLIFIIAHASFSSCGFSKHCIPTLALSLLLTSSAVIIYIIISFTMRLVKIVPKKETKLRPFKLIKCCLYAFRMNQRKNKHQVDDWLYRADSKYGIVIVRQLRMFINLLTLFFSLPLFWALEDLSQRLWMKLSVLTNTKVGVFIIQPEKFKDHNRILALFWLLILRYGGTYILTYTGLKRPLQYIIFGGFLLAIASIMSAALSLKVTSDRNLSNEYGQLRIYNPTNCTFYVNAPDITNDVIIVKNMSVVSFEHLQMEHPLLWINYTLFTQCRYIFPVAGQFNLTKGRAVGYYFRINQLVWFHDDIGISDTGHPRIRILANTEPSDATEITFMLENKKIYTKKLGNLDQFTIYPGSYKVEDDFVTFTHGRIGVLLCDKIGNKLVIHYTEAASSQSLSILFVLPHYLVAALGVTFLHWQGVRFAYVEAPEGLKTTFVGIWFLLGGFGLMLTRIVELLHVFTLSQNIIMDSMLMTISILVLVLTTLSYDYIDANMY